MPLTQVLGLSCFVEQGTVSIIAYAKKRTYFRLGVESCYIIVVIMMTTDNS